jgi:hypothetical protein
MAQRRVTQRDVMRDLVAKFGRDEERVCKEYALAEERGEVPRASDKYGISSEGYARALWRDGIQKAWL